MAIFSQVVIVDKIIVKIVNFFINNLHYIQSVLKIILADSNIKPILIYQCQSYFLYCLTFIKFTNFENINRTSFFQCYQATHVIWATLYHSQFKCYSLQCALKQNFHILRRKVLHLIINCRNFKRTYKKNKKKNLKIDEKLYGLQNTCSKTENLKVIVQNKIAKEISFQS